MKEKCNAWTTDEHGRRIKCILLKGHETWHKGEFRWKTKDEVK